MHLRHFAVSALALLAACGTAPPRDSPLDRIDTIVVIYPENRSFDNLFGLFPGADGIANATAEQRTQVDHDGTPLATLPRVYRPSTGQPDPRFPAILPNGPFRIDAPPVDWPIDRVGPSAAHNYFRHIEQINGGRNDKFVAMSDAGAWTMGYYDGSKLRMWQWALRYTLADRFFQAAYGGSFLNHQWLICACTPRHDGAPPEWRSLLDERGRLKHLPGSPPSVMQGGVRVRDGTVAPDGWAVNSAQPSYQPSGIAPAANDPDRADPAGYPLPPQTAKTIGDTLSARGVTWAWYSGAWNAALADGRRPEAEREVIYTGRGGRPNFQAHHQPFNYYERFAPGTPDRARHLKDLADFLDAIDKGTLPQVSFYKPAGRWNQHPNYTTLQIGDEHVADLLEKLEKSPQWPRMLVIVTYDENGGFWDHVPPPSGPGWSDRWGPGSRIPAILVGPTVKRGFVDHTPYDTTSIAKLITRRFGLEPLPGVREKAGDLTHALQ